VDEFANPVNDIELVDGANRWQLTAAYRRQVDG
jgi:hypothetical protein